MYVHTRNDVHTDVISTHVHACILGVHVRMYVCMYVCIFVCVLLSVLIATNLVYGLTNRDARLIA